MKPEKGAQVEESQGREARQEEEERRASGAAQHSEVGAGVKKEESLLIFVKSSQETCLKEVMKT